MALEIKALEFENSLRLEFAHRPAIIVVCRNTLRYEMAEILLTKPLIDVICCDVWEERSGKIQHISDRDVVAREMMA